MNKYYFLKPLFSYIHKTVFITKLILPLTSVLLQLPCIRFSGIAYKILCYPLFSSYLYIKPFYPYLTFLKLSLNGSQPCFQVWQTFRKTNAEK